MDPQTYYYKLKGMTPISSPHDIPFTPETIGWKIVGFVLLLLSIYIIYIRVKNYKKKEYRRVAKHHIKNITKELEHKRVSQEIWSRSILNQLKIVLIQSFGRENVASLTGGMMVQFLNERGKNTINKELYLKLELVLYNPIENNKLNINEIKSITKQINKWIGGHHV
ncbi:DUF4381 domain-containing protein [Halosquirtibacter laminarini]|uniref:DUF4381 domain-containing protein n=1 Tax=Halosquirtibacter laminarini TaxID=3374600 RepID=A0AC61NNK0_9BACT|nr:DUF4381 domain-containing protein [Prolixibacteraceae bacterium]